MPANIEAVFGRNITLVFDTLDLNTIDRNKLREILPENTPTIMDTPEMIVAVFPPQPLIIQIGDRRIRINLAIEIPELGNFPLWELAEKCYKIVEAKNASLIAYGYNFDFGISITDTTVNDLFISNFVANRNKLEQTINGELTAFLPRITYKRDKVQYDIIFEPFVNNRIKVHGNAHIQEENTVLPTEDLLSSSYIENFRRIHQVILALLKD